MAIMFGRKPPGSGEPTKAPERVAPAQFQPAAQRQAPPIPPLPAQGVDSEPRLPPRPAPVAAPQPASSSSSATPRRPAEPVREVRKLIVGREITLSGEIAACDHLIVEGTVEASVKECHRLEVSEAGLFRGAVQISEADIAGRFEGQITVQGRLSVRSTGRIQGKIQYGELAVEAGGTLDGEVHGHGLAATKTSGKTANSASGESSVLSLSPGSGDESKPSA